MSRLSGADLANWKLDNIGWTIVASVDFADGSVNLWAGPVGQSISWNGEVWNGSGDLISLDKITETSTGEQAITRATLLLDTTSDIYADVEADSTGRDVVIYVLLFDETTGASGSLGFEFEIGACEYPTRLDGDTLFREIALDLLDPKADFDRVHFVSMTDEAQQRIKSGDRGLQYISDPNLGRINAGEAQSVSGGGIGGIVGAIRNVSR